MNTRSNSKLIAALLGVAVAAGAISDASAKTPNKPIAKTAEAHAVVAKSKIVFKPHAPKIGTSVVKHVRIVHRAPVIAVKKIVHVARLPLTKGFVAKRFAAKRPAVFQKQAFAHRLAIKKTVIR